MNIPTTQVFASDDAGVVFTVSQSGDVVFTISTGTFVASTVDFTNGSNVGTTPTARTLTNTVTINVPNNGALWTNAGGTINATFTADQAATAVTTTGFYTYSNVRTVNTGTDRVVGSWSDWAPATGGSAVQRITQTRSRTVQDVTTREVRRTVDPCAFDTCMGSTATVLPLADLITNLPDETETRIIDNPNYVAPFSRDNIPTIDATIDIAGNLTFETELDSGYLNVDGMENVMFTVALAAGQTTSFGRLADGSAPVTEMVDFVVSGNIPIGHGFPMGGDAFSFPITQDENHPAPPLAVS